MHWLVEVERLGNLLVLGPYVLCCYLYRKVTRLTIVLFSPLRLCPFPLSYFPSTVHDRAKRKCRKRDCSVCTGELRAYRKASLKDMHLQHSMRREEAPNVWPFGRQMEIRHVHVEGHLNHCKLGPHPLSGRDSLSAHWA